VIYSPVILKVIAYKDGKSWAEETISTAGKAAQLRATADRNEINTGEDLAFIKVEVLDEDGNPVPGAKNLIEFSIEGPGEIIATDNGDPADLVSFSSARRHAYSGLALAIVRSKKEGSVKLYARSAGLKEANVEVKVRKK
jgi:beta-galactosidase